MVIQRIPGIQYPDLASLVPQQVDESIRNAFDNLLYLRSKVSELDTRPLTQSQVRQVTQQITINATTTATPSAGSGAPIIGTHAERLSLYSSSMPPEGTFFYETDRSALYVVSTNASMILQWTLIAAMMNGALSARPTDLGTADTGFGFYATDPTQQTEYTWTGTAWVTIGGLLQTISDAVTNAVSTVHTLVHLTSGVAAIGFGARHLVQLENAAGTTVNASAVDTAWVNAGAGTEESSVAWYIQIAGVLTAFMSLLSTGLFVIGDLFWKSGTAFLGSLVHANTADRVYTFPDETGNVVYESAALVLDQHVIGAGGAKVKPTGSAVWPLANGGTNATTAAGARASLSAAQIQAPGGPHTVPLFKITPGGTDGSITFNVEGVITGFVDPT